jgi:hypothetical protein
MEEFRQHIHLRAELPARRSISASPSVIRFLSENTPVLFSVSFSPQPSWHISFAARFLFNFVHLQSGCTVFGSLCTVAIWSRPAISDRRSLVSRLGILFVILSHMPLCYSKINVCNVTVAGQQGHPALQGFTTVLLTPSCGSLISALKIFSSGHRVSSCKSRDHCEWQPL